MNKALYKAMGKKHKCSCLFCMCRLSPSVLLWV